MSLAWLGFTLLTTHGTSHLATILIALVRLWRNPKSAPVNHPQATIIRPACGVEHDFRHTMGSSFSVRGAGQILFCVDDETDPAVPVLREIIAEHPGVDAALLIGRDRIGANPKLNNIVKGWRAANSDWIAIADSNVVLTPDYLESLFEVWDDRAGYAGHLGVGVDPIGFAGVLECAFLNTLQARWLMAGDSLGLSYPVGKSMMFRRSIVDRAGGLSVLATLAAAEDIAATKMSRQLGLRPRIARRPLDRPVGRVRFGDVWRRQTRWAKLRRRGFPIAYPSEVFLGGLMPITYAIILAATGHMPALAAAAYAVIWYAAEAVLAVRAGWPLRPLTPLAWIVRDVMVPVVWLAGLFGRRIEWRGNAMNVTPEAPGRGQVE